MSEIEKVVTAPIPREEPPPPDLIDLLKAIDRVGVAVGIVNNKADTLGATVEGVRVGLGTVQAAVVAAVTRIEKLDTRIEKLEAKAPGSNPPPRTASGFTAAVRQISQTTESEPDKATAAQVTALATRFEAIETKADRIEAKTDLQTQLLGEIIAGVSAFTKKPMVQRIGQAVGALILLALAAAAGRFTTKGSP